MNTYEVTTKLVVEAESEEEALFIYAVEAPNLVPEMSVVLHVEGETREDARIKAGAQAAKEIEEEGWIDDVRILEPQPPKEVQA